MEQYLWTIDFLDGTKRSEQEGSKLNFAELDGLSFVFSLVPQVIGLPPTSTLISDGKRLIFLRRRIKCFGPAGDKLINTIYCVGWQKTVNGSNVKNLIWINPETKEILNADDINITTQD